MGTVEISRTPSAPTQPPPPPSAGSPHQRSAFATSDGPIGSHPKSTLCLWGHPQCCAFSAFGQMCDDTYPQFEHTEEFHCPKNTLCSASAPSLPSTPGSCPSLPVSTVCLAQSVPELGSRSLCVPFQTGVFHSGIGLYRSSRAFHGLIACVFLALTIFCCLNALQFMHLLSQ